MRKKEKLAFEEKLRRDQRLADEKKVIDADVDWHPARRCIHCGGRMFWGTYENRWLCETNLYMEGGCWEEEE